MRKLWDFISYLGMLDKNKTSSNKYILNANRINFILILFSFLLVVITTVIREILNGEYTIHTHKIFILLMFCLFNVVLSYFRKHNLTKFSLIFLPSAIVVMLPILIRDIQIIDFVYDPLLIIGFSMVPQLILKPEFSYKPYFFSLLYFLIQILFIDEILVYYSDNDRFFQIVEEYHIYYKLVLVTIFIFIHINMYYLRRLNIKYEIELQENNAELETKINELNLTQQQLIQAEKMASLGILTAGVAHEINNPLNFIHGGVLAIEKYIKNKLNDHSQNLSPMINAINVGVKRASGIVTRLNHYSHKDDLVRSKCDINIIIGNCLLMLHTQINDNIEVKAQFTGLPYTIIGSEGKLHQAFINIILNSCQSIEKNGKIAITTELEDNNFVVTIIDNGCGISKVNLVNIFDPFFTTKDPGKGTGLGLSIVYNIIKEHKGSLDFESELGIGTKAIIKLPIENRYE